MDRNHRIQHSDHIENNQNLNAPLTALHDLYTNAALSAERILSDYPQLLTVATTNDLKNARTAFTNAVSTYMIACAFIRARSTNDVPLFNYDPGMAHDETDFRTTLRDLQNSLALGPQTLSVEPELTADTSPQFDGSLVLRDLLPKIDGNAIELGSFPDLTFDASIHGLRQDSVEGFFGKRITMLPVGHVPEVVSVNTLGFTFNTLRGNYYVLETSTNLMDWQVLANTVASDVTSTFMDSMNTGLTKRFYRLTDNRALPTPPPSNDNFVNRISIAGTNLVSYGFNYNASRESGEPYDISSTGGKSVWWSWTAPRSGTVTISTVGSDFDTILGIYTGTVVSALTKTASDDDS